MWLPEKDIAWYDNHLWDNSCYSCCKYFHHICEVQIVSDLLVWRWLNIHFRIRVLFIGDNWVNAVLTQTESYVITSGIIGNPFQNMMPVTYIEAPWMESTRIFLNSIQATIHIKPLQTINLLRHRDQGIMELACRHTDKNINDKQLSTLAPSPHNCWTHKYCRQRTLLRSLPRQPATPIPITPIRLYGKPPHPL